MLDVDATYETLAPVDGAGAVANLLLFRAVLSMVKQTSSRA